MRLAALVGVACWMAGCASTPTETFYALTATVEAVQVSPSATSVGIAATRPAAPGSPGTSGPLTGSSVPIPPVTVVVDQATVPELVDRPQLVVSTGETRVVLLEQQRWAEPLRSQITRTVALNLTRLLPAVRVGTTPDILDGVPEARSYRVTLDIQRFESRAGEAVVVEALWTLRRPAGPEIASGREIVSETVRGSGYEAVIAAHNRALATVSRTVAAAVREGRN